jgi:WD40 repeat protein/beta-lactamase regulating signal transducer with metallopeptidase domain
MAAVFEFMNSLSGGGAAVLADASVKSAVVLLAAAIATKFLRQAPAAVRHRVWSLGLSGALVMPLLSWIVPHMRLPLLPPKAAPAEMASESGGAAPTELPGEVVAIDSMLRDANEEIRGMKAAPFLETAASPEDLSAAQTALLDSRRDAGLLASSQMAAPLDARVYVLGLWMAGLAMVLAPLAAGFGVNRLLLRKSRRLTQARWRRLIAELSARIGLTRTVATFESPQPVVPMTWGLLRPMILVPEDWRDWPQERQRCVLLHELAHVKRLDVVFQIIGRLAAALYWFNPLVWFAVRQLRIERELACDDCVLASGERATDYARELLTIAKLYRLRPLAVGAAMAHSARLDQRVLRILDQARSHMPMSPGEARSLFITVAVVVLGVAATSLVERSTSAAAEEEKQARLKNGVHAVSYTTDQVNAVAVSSDGKLVAGGGMDRSVRIWKLDTGELLHQLRGSERIIRTVAFQPKGPLLASAGDEPVVRVWDVQAGAQVKTLRGLSPTVTSIRFSPDGKLLAGCSFRQKGPKQWQGEVVVWDVESGQAVRIVESQDNGYYRGVAFSPDGSLLAAAFDSTGSSHSSGVKLWDSKTWELKQTLLRDRGGSVSVAFSPDGRHVASGGGYVEVSDGRMATGEVKIWEIDSANIVGTLARPADGGYVAIAFSPFGSIAGQGFGPAVKTATESHAISEVTNWNPATEQPTWNVTCAFCGDPSPPAFTPDGTKLITCDSEAVRVFDAESGKELHVLMNVERSPAGPRTKSGAVDKTSDRTAALHELQFRRSAASLVRLLALNNDMTSDIEKLGHPTDSAGIKDVATIQSGGTSYVAVVGRRYPPELKFPFGEEGIGVCFLFDSDGNLKAQFGGELSADEVNGDEVLFTTLGTSDRWFIYIRRFEKQGRYSMRSDVFLVEPGFPLAFRVWSDQSLAWTTETYSSRDDFEFSYFFHPGPLDLGVKGQGADGQQYYSVIGWDTKKKEFRGPSRLTHDGSEIFAVELDSSKRFAPLDLPGPDASQ